MCDINGVIPGAVIHHDKLVKLGRVVASPDGFETLPQTGGVVPNRNDERNHGSSRSHRRRIAGRVVAQRWHPRVTWSPRATCQQ